MDVTLVTERDEGDILFEFLSPPSPLKFPSTFDGTEYCAGDGLSMDVKLVTDRIGGEVFEFLTPFSPIKVHTFDGPDYRGKLIFASVLPHDLQLTLLQIHRPDNCNFAQTGMKGTHYIVTYPEIAFYKFSAGDLQLCHIPQFVKCAKLQVKFFNPCKCDAIIKLSSDSENVLRKFYLRRKLHFTSVF